MLVNKEYKEKTKNTKHISYSISMQVFLFFMKVFLLFSRNTITICIIYDFVDIANMVI